MNPSPLLYVIILNWDLPAETIACLHTVTCSDYANFGIIVVDNGSTDDSVVQIQKAFPEIHMFQNEINLGYAEGNNIGIRYALENGAEYVLLLNNDARVEKDTLSRLAAVATDPTVGAVGGKIKSLTNPERLWAAGECFPRGEALPLDDVRFDNPGEIDYAPGCCLLMCRRALKDVGLLDANFFFIHEDLDWCYRSREAGYHIRYAPDAIAYHKLSVSSTENSSPLFHCLYVRNFLLKYMIQF